MNTLEDRVRHAINESGKDILEIARVCGISVQAVYAWRRGSVKNLQNENLFNLAEATGFEARWIGTGKGPARDISSMNHRATELLNNYAKCDERGRETVLIVAEREASYNKDA